MCVVEAAPLFHVDRDLSAIHVQHHPSDESAASDLALSWSLSSRRCHPKTRVKPTRFQRPFSNRKSQSIIE